MTRKETTKRLSVLIEQKIDAKHDSRIYWAKEVTFDYRTKNAVRVDYMMFQPVNNTISGIEKGDFYCYEIKSSVEDFKSKNGHNFIGDYNYYVMPRKVFESVKDRLPHGVGVYVTDDECMLTLYSVKQANRKNRVRPVSEMLLMMFRSAARERGKKMKAR